MTDNGPNQDSSTERMLRAEKAVGAIRSFLFSDPHQLAEIAKGTDIEQSQKPMEVRGGEPLQLRVVGQPPSFWRGENSVEFSYPEDVSLRLTMLRTITQPFLGEGLYSEHTYTNRYLIYRGSTGNTLSLSIIIYTGVSAFFNGKDIDDQELGDEVVATLEELAEKVSPFLPHLDTACLN